MKSDVISGRQHDISVAVNQELGAILQPLIRDIHLFDTWIAGTASLEDKSVLKALNKNDELILQRESNEFDSMAILVLNGDRKKLGYVPEKDNIVFARLMDAGKTLKAKISKIEDLETWIKICIGIDLMDI